MPQAKPIHPDLVVTELPADQIRANILRVRAELIREAGPNAYFYHTCHTFGQDVLDELDARGE